MRRENEDKDINKNSYDINRRNRVRNHHKDNEESDIESDIKEWDVNDEEEIQEFLSRDFDVVSESRRRMQERQKRVRRERDLSDADSHRDTHTKRVSHNKHEEEQALKMKLLFGALTVLIIILIIAIVLTNSDDNSDLESAEESTTLASEEISSNEETTEVTIEPETEDSDIHSLIVGYIDAAYIKADMEAVALVVDDTTNINVEKYNSRKKYIESYENIKCYKFDSAIENAYIVFVTYDTKLYNIETLAPSAETFIVKSSGNDKKLVIHNLTVSEELDSYIAGASKFAYTSEIRTDIENRLKEALANDTELKKVYDLMLTTGSKATEEGTSSTNTSDDVSTEQTTTAAQ